MEGAQQLAAADPAVARQSRPVLPARMRGSESMVARAAGQLSSGPLGGLSPRSKTHGQNQFASN